MNIKVTGSNPFLNIDTNFNDDFSNQKGKSKLLTQSVLERKQFNASQKIYSFNPDNYSEVNYSLRISDKKEQKPKEENKNKKKFLPEEIFESLSLLEDKVLQLFFLTTHAVYDDEYKLLLERFIEVKGLGGLIFLSGILQRQSYLVNTYEKSAQNVPLLIGHTLQHGIEIFCEKNNISVEILKKEFNFFSNSLIKDFVKNRSPLCLGVEFSFQTSMKESTAFRSLLQDIDSLLRNSCFWGEKLSLEDCSSKKEAVDLEKTCSKITFSERFLEKNMNRSLLNSKKIPERFHRMKFLNISDISSSKEIKEKLIEAFKNECSAILCPNIETIDSVSREFCSLVRLGKISMITLNNLVKRLIATKLYYSN